MSVTTEAHERIERFAATLLDLAPMIEADPASSVAATARADAERANQYAFGALARAAALHHGSATVHGYTRGPELALLHAAVIDVLMGNDRPKLQWCRHRDGLTDDRLTLINVATRFAGCPICTDEHNREHFDELDADSTCDVCGADHGIVTPRLYPSGAMLVSVHTGPCCDELFGYVQPVASTTYRRAVRVGRNEPCPCGCGRKAKRCDRTVS
jgi:hypothetical protein